MALPKKTYISNCTGLQPRNNQILEKRGRLISLIFFYLLLFAFFGVTIYVLFFSSYLKITNVTVSGNKELDAGNIKAIVDNLQQGKKFGIFSNDNFLLVSGNDIKNSILAEFKKIKDVKVTKEFPDSLKIEIQEREAFLLLCSGDKCYMIDENGSAYSEADFNSPELAQNNLVKLNDKSSKPVELGEVVVEKSYEDYLLSLRSRLNDLKINILNEYSTPSLMADEIDAKTVDGGDLLFSTQFPLEDSIKTLETVLKKQSELSDNKIEYIDLRTENKIFYKLQSQDNTENEQASDENKK